MTALDELTRIKKFYSILLIYLRKTDISYDFQ